MFSTLRTRFGIPGVISVIALVFAMFGGAYAASNSSGGGKATASAKAKKGPRGPKGATGPAGPAGAQGPAGPAGAKGDAGAAGSNGTNGSPGAPGAAGKSVISAEFEGTNEPAGEPCEEKGGSSFEVQGSGVKTYACNGAEGEGGGGSGGLPETLPAGSVETGAWAAEASESANVEFVSTALSFNIPLAEVPQAMYIPPPPTVNPDPVHCPGTAVNPQAASGWLCVYANTQIDGGAVSKFIQPFKTGARLSFGELEGLAINYGTFAVTG
jgi:Collagen triple helix repeat (20 copies)